MKLIVKLSAVVLIPSIALISFGGFQVHEKWKTAQSMKQIESLSALAVDISSLVHETQKERGRTAGFLGSGGKKFVRELPEQRSLTDQRIRKLRESLGTLDRAHTDPSLLALLDSATSRLDQIPTIRRRVSSLDITMPEAIGHYTKMNADFLDAIGGIAQMSEDSGLNTSLTAYSLFLKSKERAGIERAVLSAVFARDRFEPGEFARFISLVSQQDIYIKEFLRVASEPAAAAYKAASGDSSFAAVQSMRDIASSKSEGFGIDAGDWFSTITGKINKLKQVDDQLAAGVAAEASAIRAAASHQMIVSVVVVLAAVGVAFVFGTLVSRSIAGRVGRISRQISEAEASRDLTAQVDEAGSDEISVMAGAFNRFISSIDKLVAEVENVSQEVASAATEMAATSDQFASGLEDQSAQTSGAAAAIEQLAASVRHISSQCSEASEAAAQSRQDAELGGETVRDTVAEIRAIASDVRDSSRAINELGKRSEHIGEIINVINDIADQTNLLALNAAIEAARAGEHGRGFAVVADEVRKLAERTSNATQEVTDAIRQIQSDTKEGMERIEASVSRVDTGVEFASSAGQALERIVQSARGLGEMVTGISGATEEQAAASDDIAQRIDALRAVAEESQLAAGQSAEASNNMSTQAERLRELVSAFKV
ncbi:MAG TPA: methyl-accepting chemotaxis protein [Phycisphaerales bacterium]|nr:methyl-accepting chemotaxis protein [Phycisphaerales bacterium]